MFQMSLHVGPMWLIRAAAAPTLCTCLFITCSLSISASLTPLKSSSSSNPSLPMQVTSMTSFHSSAFPDSLAIAKGDALTIGTIDRIQKLHVRTVPLQEQPRRIAHQEATKTFAVITTQSTMTGVRDQGTDSLRLLNEQTFETLDRFAMEPKEMACSLLSTTLGVDASRVFYVVGTAMIKPDDRESDKGRLLVFEVEREKLRLVYSHPTKGAVYSLVPLTAAAETHLVAGVNSRVQVYRCVVFVCERVRGLLCLCLLKAGVPYNWGETVILLT